MRRQNGTGTYALPYTVRTGWPSFVIFLALGLFLALPFLSIIRRGPSALLPVLLLLCIIWVPIGGFLLWLGSYKIILLPDKLRYNTLFSRKEMFFADISRVTVKVVHGRGGGYILRIDARSGSPLLISMKPFSKRNMSIVVDVIATCAPTAVLDENAHLLREGTFRG